MAPNVTPRRRRRGAATDPDRLRGGRGGAASDRKAAGFPRRRRAGATGWNWQARSASSSGLAATSAAPYSGRSQPARRPDGSSTPAVPAAPVPRPAPQPQILETLASTRLGDEFAIVDCNFPAAALGCRVIRVDGVDTERAGPGDPQRPPARQRQLRPGGANGRPERARCDSARLGNVHRPRQRVPGRKRPGRGTRPRRPLPPPSVRRTSGSDSAAVGGVGVCEL